MSPPPFRKNAIKMGLIFLVGRMALCILFAIMSATTDPTGYRRGSKAPLIIQLFAPIAILFAIGAISDLVLVFGAWKKNVAAIYVSTHHMFSRILNFLFAIGFLEKK